MINVLGLDPGSKNFAYSVVSVSMKPPFRYRVKRVGMVNETITNIPSISPKSARKFKNMINKIVKDNGVDFIIAERFMNRGKMRGATGELVSIMLGTLLVGVPIKDMALITASQWKNAFNRRTSLDHIYSIVSVVPHVVDATGIALYGSVQYLPFAIKQFEYLHKNSFVRKIENAI